MNNITTKITRPELNKLAKEKCIRNIRKYNRFQLAEKLGLMLPEPVRRKEPTHKRVRARAVGITIEKL